MPTGRIGASLPPVRTTSTSPDWIRRSASWNAMIDVAQAAVWVITGPVSPHSIESMQAPIEPDRAGIANGLTKRGPRVSAVWVPSMICSIPPPPVLTTTATRSRCSGVIAPKSSPAWATASLPVAIAKWMKRLIRRAILGSIPMPGSKPFTSAAMRTSKPVASKWAIGATPEMPALRLRPVRLEVVAVRHDGSEAGDDGAAGGISAGRHAWFLVRVGLRSVPSRAFGVPSVGVPVALSRPRSA